MNGKSQMTPLKRQGTASETTPRSSVKTALFAVAAIASSVTFASNPILPLWEYVPDGEPYVFEDPGKPGKMRVYLYQINIFRGVLENAGEILV